LFGCASCTASSQRSWERVSIREIRAAAAMETPSQCDCNGPTTAQATSRVPSPPSTQYPVTQRMRPLSDAQRYPMLETLLYLYCTERFTHKFQKATHLRARNSTAAPQTAKHQVFVLAVHYGVAVMAKENSVLHTVLY
jgi:hypothetical protein